MWVYYLAGGMSVTLLVIAAGMFRHARRERSRQIAHLNQITPSANSASGGAGLLTRWRDSLLAKRLDASIDRAGLHLRSEQVVAAWVTLAIVAAVLLRFFFHFSWLAALLWGDVAVQIGWYLFTKSRRKAWEAEVTAGLPDSLRRISNLLRAGYSLPTAITLAGKEPSACGKLWQRIGRELALHQPLDEVVNRTTERKPIPALRTVTPLMLVLYEVGGDLASALDRKAQAIQEDSQAEQEMWGKSSEARSVGYILPGMALALLPILSLIMPGFASFLFSTWGLLGVALYIGFQAVVWAWIHYVAQVRL